MALHKTARDAVRRGEDDLEVARKLEKGGALEKEKRLRVEVQLADSQRLLDAAEGASNGGGGSASRQVSRKSLRAPWALVNGIFIPKGYSVIVQSGSFDFWRRAFPSPCF